MSAYIVRTGAITSLGFVAGSLLMARLSSRLREGQWLTLSVIGMGLIGTVYSRLVSVPWAIVRVIISGFMNAPASVARGVLVQRNTPREMRGRVNSVFFVTRVVEVSAGSAVVRKGESGDGVYFVLAGRAVAALKDEGGHSGYRALETLYAGDFFGEIAALTGSKRTADVVAEGTLSLLEVPAPSFRRLIAEAQLSRRVHMKFLERLTRTSVTDLPRFAGLDQQVLRELRTESTTAPVQRAEPGYVV